MIYLLELCVPKIYGPKASAPSPTVAPSKLSHSIFSKSRGVWGDCHKERFKGNGNILGGSKEGGFVKIGMKERSVRNCVGLRRLGVTVSL